MDRNAVFHIGCQSWGYDDWITKPGGEIAFYPRGTKRDEMLQQYARAFDTIEIDSTVYGLPPVSNFKSWYEKTPPDFRTLKNRGTAKVAFAPVFCKCRAKKLRFAGFHDSKSPNL